MARPGLLRPDTVRDSGREKLELREGGLELFLRLSDLPSLLLAAVFRLALDVLGLAFLSPNLALLTTFGLSSLLLPVLLKPLAVSEVAFTLEGLGSLMLGTLLTVTLAAAGLLSRCLVMELDLDTSCWELALVTTRLLLAEVDLSSFDFGSLLRLELDSCLARTV